MRTILFRNATADFCSVKIKHKKIMKKQLLASLAVALGISSYAQLTLTKTLPPVGTTYSHALKMVSKLGFSVPDTGFGKTWDYSTIDLASFIKVLDYEVLSPDSVSQADKDSVPSASFFLKGTSSTVNNLSFYAESGDSFSNVATKSSAGLFRYPTLDFVFNLAFGDTMKQLSVTYQYVGDGTLKLGSKTYSNVALFKSLPRANDTKNTFTYTFYQISPFYHRIASMTIDDSPGGINTNVYILGGLGTGLNSINNEKTFTVYPNPASDKLNLPENTISVKVYNTVGQICETHLNNNTLDVSRLLNGIYFVEIKTNNGIYNSRFVKE